jgi:transcriptional regulator with XRE-family HTH domain/desulfoferrodoxin (superoxide reductase-like protein)
MDCAKTGKLIRALRLEKGMTQRAVAEKLNISGKTVSKWENGLGCPDVSLLRELAAVFGVGVDSLLLGELSENDTDGGNMKKIKFYVCPACGNIITATGEAEISCCGRRLSPLEAKPADADHAPEISEVEDELYVVFPHPMTKAHYLSFAACVGSDRMHFVRLYPEQDAAFRMPRMRGTLYFYCAEHGLMKTEI